MGYQKRENFGGNHEWFVILTSVILLSLCSPSSANFTEIYSVRVGALYGAWLGIPVVAWETNATELQCQICVDDTHWNKDIADAICQYNGFKGAMIINNDTTPSAFDMLLDGYAVCNKIDTSGVPLECEFRETCNRVPTISCFVPGYEGCFTETTTNPFISDGVLANIFTDIDIQTCALACAGSLYLGLTNKQRCICGSTLGDRSRVGVCDVECRGNPSQQCGGEDAISVYSANVIGQCGSEGVELMPDQPYSMSSPNSTDFYESNVGCTWTLTLDVDTAHALDISMTYAFKYLYSQQFRISSATLGQLKRSGLSSSGFIEIIENPYRALQDIITVSFTWFPPYQTKSSASFDVNVLLTSIDDGGNEATVNQLAMSAAIAVVVTALLIV